MTTIEQPDELARELEALACDCDSGEDNDWEDHEWRDAADLLRRSATALRNRAAAPDKVEPTEAMLNAARDWSAAEYGKPIGNDAATGCWQAMLTAALKEIDHAE